MIVLERLYDVNTRGHECLVYDYDNSIVLLKNATIWYENGKYVYPKEYKKESFFNFLNFFN